MRGFLIGIALALVTIAGVASVSGGLRHRLYNAGRRLKLALVLVGIYLLASALVRLTVPASWSDWGLPSLALLLAVVFVVLGQDRNPPGQPAPGGQHEQTGQR